MKVGLHLSFSERVGPHGGSGAVKENGRQKDLARGTTKKKIKEDYSLSRSTTSLAKSTKNVTYSDFTSCLIIRLDDTFLQIVYSVLVFAAPA